MLSATSSIVDEGDSYLIEDVLPPGLASIAFETLKSELEWSEMYHKGGAVPRLVCIQGEVDENGVQPIYRHPADEQPPLSPWTPFVKQVRDVVSHRLGGQTLNHALIQLYRDGDDYISEHADKTIDIQRGTAVVNLSLGATRTMVLRPKKDLVEKGTPRSSTKFNLPHASLFVLGWDTNRCMTHEIRRDRRDSRFKTNDELAHGGCRISLTFRTVATFVDKEGNLSGQGSKNDNTAYVDVKVEEEELIKAFSVENRSSNYDWDELYSKGFSVVNFKTINSSNSSKVKI